MTPEQQQKLAGEMMEFVLDLAREGERSAVVLGAARLDVALEHFLKKVIQNHPTRQQDNLFDQNRPLRSFSAKIALAYRLGLLEKDLEEAMGIIRKIRTTSPTQLSGLAFQTLRIEISFGSSFNASRRRESFTPVFWPS
jgi:hypothetical protein